jgi:hypothetical protein
MASRYYRQAVPGDFRHLHRAADQHALGGAHQFERGFIDYIKRGNEQRLTMLGDALSEQYALHGNWKFLRNNDRFIFQLLKSFERDNDDRFPAGAKQTPAARLTAAHRPPDTDGPPPDGPPPDGPRGPGPDMPRTAGARFSGLSIRKDACWLARASGA